MGVTYKKVVTVWFYEFDTLVVRNYCMRTGVFSTREYECIVYKTEFSDGEVFTRVQLQSDTKELCKNIRCQGLNIKRLGQFEYHKSAHKCVMYSLRTQEKTAGNQNLFFVTRSLRIVRRLVNFESTQIKKAKV